MTSSVAVFEAATWINQMYSVYDKIMIENQKKEKIWKSKTFLHNSPSDRWFRNGIHSLLNRADARGRADFHRRRAIEARDPDSIATVVNSLD